jgi:hypothetical protein
MTRNQLLARLHHLETQDPRSDPRHVNCSVWIWERDQIVGQLHALENSNEPPLDLSRPSLGPHTAHASQLAHATVAHIPLWIAVELAEAGYIMQRWPAHQAIGNLWQCEVSDASGRRYGVSARLEKSGLQFTGLPNVMAVAKHT